MKQLETVLLCLSAAAILSACGSPARAPAPQPQAYKYWGKEGVSSQTAKDQLGYCRHEVGASHLPREQAAKLVGFCMRSKGYSVMTRYR